MVRGDVAPGTEMTQGAGLKSSGRHVVIERARPVRVSQRSEEAPANEAHG